MKNYSLVEIDGSSYKYLVIATSYINPVSILEDIENDIGTASGNVLFDLTLINGTNSNRYLSAMISNGVFLRRSFIKIANIDKNIRLISNNFFMKNSEIVDRGTIPDSLKYLLKLGENI